MSVIVLHRSITAAKTCNAVFIIIIGSNAHNVFLSFAHSWKRKTLPQQHTCSLTYQGLYRGIILGCSYTSCQTTAVIGLHVHEVKLIILGNKLYYSSLVFFFLLFSNSDMKWVHKFLVCFPVFSILCLSGKA